MTLASRKVGIAPILYPGELYRQCSHSDPFADCKDGANQSRYIHHAHTGHERQAVSRPMLTLVKVESTRRWWGAGLLLFIFVIERLWLSMTFPDFSDTLQKEAACGGCRR